MTYRRASWGLVALIAASAACFDSDDKLQAVATTTTGEPTTTTTTTGTTTTTDPTTGAATTTGSDVTCRDAIDCIFECAAAIQAQLSSDPGFEPDLSCFLECEELLSVEEAYKLLKLGNCASDRCAEMGECSMGGGSSGTSGGSDSSGSSTDGGVPPPDGPLDPCIMCIFVLMLDEEYEGCSEFAMECT